MTINKEKFIDPTLHPALANLVNSIEFFPQITEMKNSKFLDLLNKEAALTAALLAALVSWGEA